MSTVSNAEKDFNNAKINGLITEEQFNINLKILNYIKLLSNTTNTNINKWTLDKLFCVEGNPHLFLTDKKLINKIFFEKLQKISEKKTKEIGEIELPFEVTNALGIGIKKVLEEKKKQASDNVDAATTRFQEWSDQFNYYMEPIVAAKKNLAIFSCENPTVILKKDLSDTLKEGLWINPVIHNGFLYLNTATNLILTHNIPSANVDVSVDFGQIAVMINLDTFSFSCLPYKKNIAITRPRNKKYFHPHVDFSGIICWGNAREAAREFISNFQIGKTLNLLYAVLTQYNDGNPYVRIVDFKRDSTAYGKCKEDLRHPDKIKEKNEEIVEEVVVAEVTVDPNPLFCVGDIVEFELDQSDQSPRWNFNSDNGGNGRYQEATVTSILYNNVCVEWWNSVQNTWVWALPGNSKYCAEQWTRPGFLRKVRNTTVC